MPDSLKHVLIVLGIFTVGLLAVVAGCLDAPSNNSNPVTEVGENSPALIDCEFVDVPDNGKLYRLPVDVEGETAPTLLAKDLNFPWGLYVDQTSQTLYFTEDGTGDCTGTIKALPIDVPPQSVPELVTSKLDRPVSPVIHEGYLYYSQYKQENGSVNRINLQTGAKEVIKENLKRPFAIKVEDAGEFGTMVYFTEDGSIENDYTDGTVWLVQNSLDGTIHEGRILADNLHRPLGLGLGETYVYFTEMDGGRVSRVNKFLVDPPQEVLMTGLITPYPPVLDGNELFFAEFNAGDEAAGKIYKISGVDIDSDLLSELTPDDCGTSAPLSCTLLAESLNWPMAVAVDSEYIYWTEIYSSSIKRVGKNGNPSEVAELANGTEYEFKTSPWLATDGGYLFFADLGNAPCCFGRF